MNSNNEQLIKYLCGEMLPDEKTAFEELLKKSPRIMQQKINYEKLLVEMKAAGNPPVNEDYFTAIIPAFRTRLDKDKKRKRKLTWVYSLSSGTAAVIILMILFIFPSRTEVNFGEVINEMNQSELTALINDMEIDIITGESDQGNGINDAYINELSLNTDESLIDDLFTFNELYNSVSDTEAEIIYNEMINKDIFRN